MKVEIGTEKEKSKVFLRDFQKSSSSNKDKKLLNPINLGALIRSHSEKHKIMEKIRGPRPKNINPKSQGDRKIYPIRFSINL
jgi:hypothetical protein